MRIRHRKRRPVSSQVLRNLCSMLHSWVYGRLAHRIAASKSLHVLRRAFARAPRSAAAFLWCGFLGEHVERARFLSRFAPQAFAFGEIQKSRLDGTRRRESKSDIGISRTHVLMFSLSSARRPEGRGSNTYKIRATSCQLPAALESACFPEPSPPE